MRKVISEEKILKVVKGALVVVKGTQKGHLHYLDGSTIIGRVAICNNLEDIEVDESRLWHMGLGYVREKALQSMVRQGLLKGTKTRKVSFYEHCIFGKQIRVKLGTTLQFIPIRGSLIMFTHMSNFLLQLYLGG